MRTGRDDEKISLPFNIDKPWMKRAVFLDFSAHLLITAFANSHLKVLRQCNAVIIRAFEISKASQVSYMLIYIAGRGNLRVSLTVESKGE